MPEHSAGRPGDESGIRPEVVQAIFSACGSPNPRTAMRYIKPGGEAVAEITGLLGPSRRRH